MIVNAAFPSCEQELNFVLPFCVPPGAHNAGNNKAVTRGSGGRLGSFDNVGRIPEGNAVACERELKGMEE